MKHINEEYVNLKNAIDKVVKDFFTLGDCVDTLIDSLRNKEVELSKKRKELADREKKLKEREKQNTNNK